MSSRRSGGATGRGRRAVEGRVVRLDEGGRSAWMVEGRLMPLDDGEGLHGQ